MTQHVKAGIVGSTGYLGTELLRWLLNHPNVTVEKLASATSAGKSAQGKFPGFGKALDHHTFVPMSADALAGVDVVFLATPSGVARDLAPSLLAKGLRVIDLSGDHRLSAANAAKHYGAAPTAQGAVYGLPELNANAIKSAKLVANPGCYPTASALALLPLAKAGLVEGPAIITAVSGVTGAGKEPSEDLHFPEMNESARAYKVGTHRHEPEIAETLGIPVAFTPMIIPMNRGIAATAYVKPKGAPLSEGELRDLYAKSYAADPFVQVTAAEPDTKFVRNTNMCHVKPHAINSAGYYIVTSAIDNLAKGGSGQAVENMNIMFGLPRTAGLTAFGGI